MEKACTTACRPQSSFQLNETMPYRAKGKEMDNTNTDFETWFGILSMQVLDRTGVDFKDEDSVRSDYEQGRDVHDVVDEIAAEYGEE